MITPPNRPHPVQDLKSWMIDTALPFWATAGVDPRTGVFFERTHPNGAPDLEAPMRVRVQFRQIYTLSHAAVVGWFPQGARIALDALDPVLKTFHGLGGRPGFAHIVGTDGTVIDARRDSYDHAFAVLALAWLARATGDAAVRRLLDETLAYVDARLMAPDGALWEGEQHHGPRRQNPQMHWFEAMLALKDALDHPDALLRIAQARSVFDTRLFDRATGTLGEYFTEDWRPAPGAAGASVEPGHQAEWTWLLRTQERLLGHPPGDEASLLLATALKCADPVSGLLVDEVDRSLAIRRGTRRSWLQTELVKAQLAEAEIGISGARAAALLALEALDRHHLRRPFAAGWIDQLDEAGAPVETPVPASILYHVFVAVLEADRILGAA